MFVLPYRTFGLLDLDFDAIAAALNSAPGVTQFVANGGTLIPVNPVTYYQHTGGASFENLGAGNSNGQTVTIFLNVGSGATIIASGKTFAEDSSSLVNFASVTLAWLGFWTLVSSQGVSVF